MTVTINLWEHGNTSYDVVMGPPPPPPLYPDTFAAPINLRPGYVISTTRAYVSVNGTYSYESASSVTLDDPGYYEVDVGDSNGKATRYPICIVDSSTISVGMAAPDAGAPPAFARLSALLAPAYPRGNVLPAVTNHTQRVKVTASSPVVVEVRARKVDADSYAKVSTALVKRPGSAFSETFSVPRGSLDFRLAVVFADQNLVLV